MEKPESFKKYETSRDFARPTPSILYHYTSPESAKSILESNSFWATDCRYLNDPTEVLRNLEIADKRANLLFEEFGVSREEAASWNTERFLSDEAYRSAAVLTKLVPEPNMLSYLIDDLEVYIVSFSENGDSLSQWRAYCSSGGYALGFEPENLSVLRAELAPCIYLNEDEIEEVFDYHLRELVRERLGSSSVIPENITGEEWVSGIHYSLTDRVNQAYVGGIHDMATIIKDATFAEEREWRLVGKPGTMGKAEPFFPSLGEAHRVANNLLTPYAVFQLEKLPLKEVIVGPTRFGHLAERSIKRFLRDDNVDVKRTKTPYIS